VGLSTHITQLETSLDVFKLKLKSELVFGGDAGVSVPSGDHPHGCRSMRRLAVAPPPTQHRLAEAD
jgi:hypothetical protein